MSKTTYCHYCSNSRYIMKDERCPTCYGSGKVNGYKCYTCHGHCTIKVKKSCPHCQPPCFITTATVLALNKGDNCTELETFRRFRDEYVLQHHPEEIAEYYEKSPAIVKAIDESPVATEIYTSLWENHLVPAFQFILEGSHEEAYGIYKETVIALEARFLNIL